MKKKRVIPVLLLRDNWLVQSRSFNEYKKIGNPVDGVKRFSDWDADELIYLDIDQGRGFSPERQDRATKGFNSALEALTAVSAAATMPITIGGGIENLAQIEEKIVSGADKIAVNTKALTNPNFIAEASKEFGRQCIVASVDYKIENGIALVYNRNINQLDLPKLEQWTKQVEDLGAGEILLNCVDRDGMKTGYDLDTLGRVAEEINIPVIGCGGAGNWSHMADLLTETKVDAAAAANLFHFQDQSIYLARMELIQLGIRVRPPSLSTLR